MTQHERSLVLITGGSRGIGRHLAAGFAHAGHPVLLTATTAQAAEDTAVLLRGSAHGRIRGTSCDVTAPESIARLHRAVQAAEAAWDCRLQIVINCAGLIESSEGPLWQADLDDLTAVLMTNALGPVRIMHALIPHLLEVSHEIASPVRIIDLNSGSGATGTPLYPMYSASKAALFRIAESVHHFGFEDGLRIFEMSPGVVDTDMTRSMPVHDSRAAEDWTAPSEVVELALALAHGGLDHWSGRYMRAGADSPADLAAREPAVFEGRVRLDTGP